MADTIFIPLLVFLSVLAVLGGVSLTAASLGQRRRVVEKIRSMGAPAAAAPGESPALEGAPAPGLKGDLLRLFGRVGSRLHRPAEVETEGVLRRRFLQAGIRLRNAGPAFYGLKIVLAAALPVGALLLSAVTLPAVPVARLTLALSAVAVLGFYLPDFGLHLLTSARQEKISRGFPDALDLMVVCVEAGMGLDATINRVGEELQLRNPVIAEELRLVGLELRAGKPRHDALHNLGMRSGLDDVRSLVSLLVQTDRFGTSLAQALRVHSESMRARRYQRAEEQAARLPVKLIFPLAFFILPALFVTILGPAAIRIYRTLIVTLP